MKYLILHAGPHKTASTYIQHNLKINSKILLKNDIKYFSYKITREEFKKRNFNFFHKLLNNKYKYNILSDEAFSKKIVLSKYLDPIIKICNELNRKLIIIYYVRNQCDLINSHYCHDIRRFYHTQTFEEYLDDFNLKEIDLCKKFSYIFEMKDVEIKFIPFIKGNDPFKDFLSVLKINLDLKIESEKVNTQLGKYGTWIAIILHKLLKKHNFFNKDTNKMSFANIIRSIIPQSIKDDKYYGFTKENYLKIQNYFYESNKKFSNLVWEKEWTDIFDQTIHDKNIYNGPDNKYEKKNIWKIMEKALKDLKIKSKNIKIIKVEFKNMIVINPQ